MAASASSYESNVHDDGDGTAIADEDDRLSAGDERDEVLWSLAGDGKEDGIFHSPIIASDL